MSFIFIPIMALAVATVLVSSLFCILDFTSRNMDTN